jgi:hypothetical protein
MAARQEAPQAAERDRARDSCEVYKEYHDDGYDEYGSKESQHIINNGEFRGQGLANVV